MAVGHKTLEAERLHIRKACVFVCVCVYVCVCVVKIISFENSQLSGASQPCGLGKETSSLLESYDVFINTDDEYYLETQECQEQYRLRTHSRLFYNP